jgi:hypothetical protein
MFPVDSYDTILKSVFRIAIHLAYGTRIALAPAVLASIYRDLSLLTSYNNYEEFKSHYLGTFSIGSNFGFREVSSIEVTPL